MAKYKFDPLDQQGIVPKLLTFSSEPLPEKLTLIHPVIPTAEELIQLANESNLFIFRRRDG